MKKTLLTTLLLSAIIFSAGAEKIIFENTPSAPDGYKDAPITGTAKIDANTGDITVTANNHWIVGEESASVAFYPEKSYVQSDNEYVNFHWTLNFAGNCSASSNNWDISNPNTSNNIEYSKNVYIGTVGSSGKTFSIECNKLIGTGSITKSFTINKIDNNSGGGTTPTASLSANSTTVSANENVTLTWSSQNANRCEASVTTGSATWWSGTLSTSGSKSGSISANTTFKLTCYNANNDSVDKDVTVYFNNGGGGTPPANCPSAPAGTTLAISDTLYSLTNTTGNNNPLINAGTGRVNFELYAGTYAAISFTAPPAGDGGTIGFENPPGGQVNPGAYRVTISRCPGDFASGTGGIPQTYGCGRQGNPSSLTWSTETNAHPSKCKLEGGQYYLNIIHSSDYPNYINSSCTSSKCGVLFAIN